MAEDYIPLHPTLPITTRKFHVLHGCTSKGVYESSAIFFRYQRRGAAGSSSQSGREFLFFGDVESDWRRQGEGGVDREGQVQARGYNGVVWHHAARVWDEDRLAGVFVSRGIRVARDKRAARGVSEGRADDPD